MATILGIESTCDETAASVVVDGVDVRSSVIASQVEIHQKFRGVVPEIASRAHIGNLLPVLSEAIKSASLTLDDLDAIAVAHRPGLIGSLLIGVTAAKTLAWAIGKPLIAVDHVHAHLFSVNLSSFSTRTKMEAGIAFPAIGLVCSGGHTALYLVRDWNDITLIGATIDDAVGEAYDKVAAILGLAYPGGPIIDRLARDGDPKAIAFPRSMLGRDSLDFSFSGLKTAVLYHVRGVPGRDAPRSETSLDEQSLRDIAASFQAACIDTLVKKLRRATKKHSAKSIIIGGGVSANSGLRDAMSRFGLPAYFPSMEYCTDNAAMIAGLGDLHFSSKRFAPLDLDAITHSQFSRES